MSVSVAWQFGWNERSTDLRRHFADQGWDSLQILVLVASLLLGLVFAIKLQGGVRCPRRSLSLAAFPPRMRVRSSGVTPASIRGLVPLSSLSCGGFSPTLKRQRDL